MEKLLESYKSLCFLATQVLFFIEAHKTLKENEELLNQIKFKDHYSNLPFSASISGTLLNYSLIIGTSFFDEYNREFTSSKHPLSKQRIDRLKQITKPVMRRLSKWPHLKDYRNYMLAHSFRFKDQSIFDKEFRTFRFIVPHTNSEIILMTELMGIIITCISQEFPELQKKMDFNENMLTKISFEWNEIKIDKEINEIWKKIDTIKKDF